MKKLQFWNDEGGVSLKVGEENLQGGWNLGAEIPQ
jgi:hypothetical protein